MINWDKVNAYLSLYLKSYGPEDTLGDLLNHLYTDIGLSWRQIAKITEGYVSQSTLRGKAKLMGIKMEPRGGPNNVRIPPDISEKEYTQETITTLAKRYKVCRETVVKVALGRGWEKKKSGRPVNLFAQVVDLGSDL